MKKSKRNKMKNNNEKDKELYDIENEMKIKD